MRVLISLLLIISTMEIACADNFFQNNNPFPMQTTSQSLNNIYETTPAAIQQEKTSAKKVSKSKWWSVKDESQTTETPAAQRVEDSGFVIFK